MKLMVMASLAVRGGAGCFGTKSVPWARREAPCRNEACGGESKTKNNFRSKMYAYYPERPIFELSRASASVHVTRLPRGSEHTSEAGSLRFICNALDWPS